MLNLQHLRAHQDQWVLDNYEHAVRDGNDLSAFNIYEANPDLQSEFDRIQRTTNVSHGLSTGDEVCLSGIAGMTEMTGERWLITSTGVQSDCERSQQRRRTTK